MSAHPRYAVYFVPGAETELYRFGSTTVGYDCYTGDDAAPLPGIGASPSEWAALTAEPRTYGFHATLKAPFRLRPECREADLLREFRCFAAARREAPSFDPAVAELGRFLAIVPRKECLAITDLAADCVTTFDRFRAPLTAADRARRLTAPLTPREVENLDRWGYPYVFADFRFHMTLTGRIESPARSQTLELLRNRFSVLHGDRAIEIDRLALVRQDLASARFRVLEHAPIAGSA